MLQTRNNAVVTVAAAAAAAADDDDDDDDDVDDDDITVNSASVGRLARGLWCQVVYDVWKSLGR